MRTAATACAAPRGVFVAPVAPGATSAASPNAGLNLMSVVDQPSIGAEPPSAAESATARTAAALPGTAAPRRNTARSIRGVRASAGVALLLRPSPPKSRRSARGTPT